VKVLGIDPGTAACGYGIVEEADGRVRAACQGCWRTPAGQRLDRRLLTIFEGITTLIVEYRPDAVAIEESYVGADARVALSVGQARGVAMVAAASSGIDCVEYAPSRIKQAVTGYGQADKRQVQLMVQRILALAELPRPDHAADALAVAICHALAPPLLRAVS
jgi:crossover junction endodeoxyribonuclease RuvC